MKIFWYDAGHPWIVYWIIHALYLIDPNLDSDISFKQIKNQLIDLIS